MKTTIDIADPLLERARRVAHTERTTVRRLVEDGLSQVLALRDAPRKPYHLKPFKTRGGGFQPGFEDGSWEKIRDELYRGRGA
jgi:hypothetical protein